MEDLFIYLTIFILLRNLLFAELLSPLFLFSILSFFLYIIPYWMLDKFIYLNLINPEYVGSFYLFIFLSIVGFTSGHEISRFKTIIPKKSLVSEINFAKFNQGALIAGAVGFVFYTYFILSGIDAYLTGHNSGNYSVGGYVYELRYFIFSAILLVFNSYLLKKISKREFYVLILLSIYLIFDAYIQEQRGSWIRFVIIIGFSYVFLKIGPNLKLYHLIGKYIYLLPLLPLPVLLLTFALKSRNYENQTVAEKISSFATEITNDPSVIIMGSAPDEGNEFVFAFNAFQGREVSGVSDMGLKWIYPPLNFVPRAIWKEKPHWNSFSISVFEIVNEYSHIYAPEGSAETGIIETGFRFAWLAPLFMLLLGFFSFQLFQKASLGSLHDRCFYICYYIGLFYFITQNMLPFFIFTLYMYIPIYGTFKYAIEKGKE